MERDDRRIMLVWPVIVFNFMAVLAKCKNIPWDCHHNQPVPQENLNAQYFNQFFGSPFQGPL